MQNPVLLAIKSAVWGLSCSLLWQCDPQPSLSTWQCNARDGSVWQNGVIVDASLPCNWGLTEESATRSSTCAGAETLASIEKKEVSRENLQVVVVRHEEDITWSDPFAAVRTVYKKSGKKLSVHPLVSSAVTASPDAAIVELPNVGQEQHAYLVHIVRNYDSLAERTVFLHGKMSTCGFYLANKDGEMGNHLLTNVSVLDYLQAGDDLYMPITGRANHDLSVSSFRSTFADGLDARARVSRPVPAYPNHGNQGSNADGGDDRWLEWEVNDLQQHAKDVTLIQGVLRADELIDFKAFFQRVVGRAPPAVLYFAQGAQFAASRTALRSTPKATYQWVLELIEAGHFEVTFYLEMIWLYVLHGAEEMPEWNATATNPVQALPFLDHLKEKRAVLAANADSEELAADLLDAEGQNPALRSVMAHRGSPGFEAMLLAQLDTATKEAMLPCSVQEGVNWQVDNLEPHATWGAASCLARCARHDKCTVYGFAPPPKDSELPGRCFLKEAVDTDSYSGRTFVPGFVAGT